jgi:hypothetical protein
MRQYDISRIYHPINVPLDGPTEQPHLNYIILFSDENSFLLGIFLVSHHDTLVSPSQIFISIGSYTVHIQSYIIDTMI